MIACLAILRRDTVVRSGRVLSELVRKPARRRGGLAEPISRERFVGGIGGSVLEIGPFDNPSLRGPGVRYFDILSTEQLAERAIVHGRSPEDCPHIDYVSPLGDLGIVDATFDCVFSSHAIEHQPDLIAHLNGVERLLDKGGRYYLAVPDKRFCFDHFHAASEVGEVLEAHGERRRVHTRAAVLKHAQITHNDALRHWLGLHGRPNVAGVSAADAERDARLADAGTYIDVHAWMFTPARFLAIFTALHERGATAMAPVTVHDTLFGDLEFFAVLERR